ncbi:MAG: protein kinase [Sandaracinaceae bacterium]|nr:protein kinase [Sandaracinaceae bacterium]
MVQRPQSTGQLRQLSPGPHVRSPQAPAPPSICARSGARSPCATRSRSRASPPPPERAPAAVRASFRDHDSRSARPEGGTGRPARECRRGLAWYGERAWRQGDVVAGRYRLIERLGAGGMGEVWRAEQTALGREVALKLVQEGAAQALGDARARFRREAELAAEVEHRNVVGIIDFGTTDEGTQYLVMPLLKGEPLESRLARRPPSILELLEWTRGVLGGLAAIHDKGIVHRDLKPANVFLAEDADGVVPKLLDFGISRRSEAGAAGLTALGTAIGTPRYMAPEQFESARDVDARADLWSAGAMLYEALAGRAPYESADPFAIFRAMLEDDPPPLASLRPELPAALAEIVHRALAREPGQRFESARAMREAVDGLLASGALGEDGARLVARASASGAALAPTVAGASGAPVARTVAMSGATQAMAPPARSGSTQAMAPPTQVVSAPLEAAPKPAARGPALAALGAALLAAAGGGGYLLWSADDPSEAPIASVAEPPSDSGRPAIDAGAEPPAVQQPPQPSGWVVSGAPTDLSILAQTWASLPEPLRAAEGAVRGDAARGGCRWCPRRPRPRSSPRSSAGCTEAPSRAPTTRASASARRCCARPCASTCASARASRRTCCARCRTTPSWSASTARCTRRPPRRRATAR